MKLKQIQKHIVLLTLGALLGFTSCVFEEEQSAKNIDDAAEQTKQLVDKFSTKAKELLNDKSIDEVKNLIDEIAGKSKGVQEDAGFWKSKLQEISENSGLKDQIDGLTKDADGLLKNKAVKETLDNFLSGKNVGSIIEQLIQNPDDGLNENFWAEKLKHLKEDKEVGGIISRLKKNSEKLKDEQAISDQIDQIKNDPNVKALLEKYSNDAEDIILQFEKILNMDKES